MKIYIVTDGCYSDYGIRAVFTDKALAEKYMAAYSFDEPQIEEFDTDIVEENVKLGRKKYTVEMRKDGNNAKAELSDIEDYPWNNCTDYIYKEDDGLYLEPRLTDFEIEIIRNTVWATDKTHAIKIANERRTRCIAEGRWILTEKK